MGDEARATVTDQATLREIIGPKMPLAIEKEMPRLDHHCRNFVALSPFLCIGTMGEDGKADVSPRGDPPGFVKVLDDRTILIPDRPGNRRVDSMMASGTSYSPPFFGRGFRKRTNFMP